MWWAPGGALLSGPGGDLGPAERDGQLSIAFACWTELCSCDATRLVAKMKVISTGREDWSPAGCLAHRSALLRNSLSHFVMVSLSLLFLRDERDLCLSGENVVSSSPDALSLTEPFSVVLLTAVITLLSPCRSFHLRHKLC